ncbi:hypothetical protein GOP47_0016785 [Adiantum capillus-veneris]|uniref:Leucine-rich repeat-containing N-terminal plant-type domain-containing protein n=1 Tax=Adiantum capillus-veneris TaxID=13818 RepID=A0A9D4ZCF0_ADICA|nr:hypothetical protein GOP47_0016785 [Adiantum capillus-veneris]
MSPVLVLAVVVAMTTLSLAAPDGASAQGFNVQVDALIAFKNGLQDPQGALASWDPSSVDPCTWFHVTCDANNNVQSINLGLSGLSGTISPRLADLHSLRDLSLEDNSLSGSIPGELGHVTSLFALNLFNNRLTGSIPPQLTLLPNLQLLHLFNNDLSGPIPTGGSFSRFSSDSFMPGNPRLCGAVINKHC